MIIGIGTDIFLISRLFPLLSEPKDPFWLRSYTEAERKQASVRPCPAQYLATRFAGKEAVFKAISCITEEFEPGHIQILDSDAGKPYVTLHPSLMHKLLLYTGTEEITIHLSLSYENEYALATAVAEAGNGG